MLTEEQATEYLLKHVDEFTTEQLHHFVVQYIEALKNMREITRQLAEAQAFINSNGLRLPTTTPSKFIN